MKNKLIKILPLILLVFGFFFMGFKGAEDKDNKVKKPSGNDDYKYIAINQILMWLSNNGDGSHDPRTDGNGFYWPGGLNAQKSAVFEDGLIFGAKVGREIRVNGNTHRQGLQAGKILPDGTPDDPGLEKYRVYKIQKGWELLPPGPEKDAFEKDYNEWPIEDGAPYVDVDGDGLPTPGVDLPQFIGDQVLWYVANDMDPQRSTYTYGTLPMGLEFQTTIFAFNRTGALGDMLFKKYKMINKGSITLRDMIVAYWSDTDLGDAGDDFTGSDTTLSLGYTWNSDNVDGNGSGSTYGSPPPAMGYDFFQGPIVPSPGDSAKFLTGWRQGYRNLPMTAFALYINEAGIPWRDPQMGVPEGSIEFYYYLQGYVWDGSSFVDPHTNLPSRFVLTGDPETGTGWYEGKGWPGGPAGNDRRHVMSSGPFTLAPGDTQEIVVGLLIAKGSNNLNSVTALKTKDKAAQIAYDLDFKLTPAPPAPTVHAVPGDRQLTLWWETNSESYDAFDPLLTDTITTDINGQKFVFPVTNKNYKFEGYRLWQFRDEAGTEPMLIATYDVQNGIGEIRNFIYDTLKINDSPVPVEPYVSGPDLGLQRQLTITQDAFTNGPLNNGNPYYFAVTAYGYSKYSDPPILESPPSIQVFIPGKEAIDQDFQASVNSNLFLDQVSGNTDAIVKFKIIDPSRLTGHKYAVEFYGPDNALNYRLINTNTGDTLLKDQKRFVTFLQDPVTKEYYVPENDTVGNVVIDGFMPLVQNIGSDSIRASTGAKYKVQGVYEVVRPDGSINQNPPNLLYGERNSTGAYTIKAGGTKKDLVWQQDLANQSLGYKDYELRFTGTSQFYASGRNKTFPPAIVKSDTIGLGTVPFQIWDIGRTPTTVEDDKQLVIKIVDNDLVDTTNKTVPDKMWSRTPNGTWEQIFGYAPTAYGPANMPPTSGSATQPQLPFGAFIIDGEQPAQGSVLRVVSFKPITAGDRFEGTPVPPPASNPELAKNSLNEISVFPNPYFGANSLERDKYQRFMRFTNLPKNVTVRIFTLSGVFVQRLEKDSETQYLDWDLRNKDGIPVASGVYIAYLDIPNVGSKIMKLAVIMETQFIDRL